MKQIVGRRISRGFSLGGGGYKKGKKNKIEESRKFPRGRDGETGMRKSPLGQSFKGESVFKRVTGR